MKVELLIILIAFFSMNCMAQEGSLADVNYSASKLKYNDTSGYEIGMKCRQAFYLIRLLKNKKG